MGIAPSPHNPERAGTVFERKMGLNASRRGPLRFEEGVATDTDVPSDFKLGIRQGYESAPGHPNHNKNVYEKRPDETMRERAHLGSSAWTEAPTFLSEFSGGAMADYNHLEYQEVKRNGSRQERHNPASIKD